MFAVQTLCCLIVCFVFLLHFEKKKIDESALLFNEVLEQSISFIENKNKKKKQQFIEVMRVKVLFRVTYFFLIF